MKIPTQVAPYLAILATATLTIPIISPSWRLAGFSIAALCPALLMVALKNRTTAILTLSIITSMVAAALHSWTKVKSGKAFGWDLATNQLTIALLLPLVACLTLWILKYIPIQTFVIVWSLGLLIFSIQLNTRFADNPWKFGLALPITLLALVAVRKKTASAFFLVLAASAGLSMAMSFRAWLLILALTAVLLMAADAKRNTGQMRRRKKSAYVGPVSLFAVSVVGISSAIGEWALRGQLGDYAQQRAKMSMESTGNPLIGNRAEWGAAWALFTEDMNGFGIGIIPSARELAIATNGLLLPDLLKSKSNVYNSFVNGRPEFHSLLWNTWAPMGILGFAVILLIIYILVRAIAICVIDKGFSPKSQAIILLICISALWDIAFSPSNPWTTGVALGLAIHTSGTFASAIRNEKLETMEAIT